MLQTQKLIAPLRKVRWLLTSRYGRRSDLILHTAFALTQAAGDSSECVRDSASQIPFLQRFWSAKTEPENTALEVGL